MDSSIIPFRPVPTPAIPATIAAIDLYGALCADAKNPRTMAARREDLTDLARFLGLPGPGDAAGLVCSGAAGQANAVVIAYQRHMLDRKLSAATINRRISSIRRLAKLARRLQVIDWALDVDGLKTSGFRDTAGPGHDGWRKLLDVATIAAAGGSPKGARDLAIVRLLHDNGLRRGELVELDLADLDVPGLRVAVAGKGRSGEKRWLTMNGPTAEALARWVGARGTIPGPAFTRLDRADGGRMGRLTGHGVHRIVRELGDAAGLGRPARPHGLRHEGATRLLELTNGNVRAVQRWTRHSDVKTVLAYDDNRSDIAGAMARVLGSDA
jgi:integrase/recombinase XerC